MSDLQDKRSYEDEPLLRENPQRFVLLPIQYSKIWEMYKNHMASFWTAEEIDLAQDLRDWESLNDGEQHFIKNVLAFFSSRFVVLKSKCYQSLTLSTVMESFWKTLVPASSTRFNFLKRVVSTDSRWRWRTSTPKPTVC